MSRERQRDELGEEEESGKEGKSGEEEVEKGPSSLVPRSRRSSQEFADGVWDHITQVYNQMYPDESSSDCQAFQDVYEAMCEEVAEYDRLIELSGMDDDIPPFMY